MARGPLRSGLAVASLTVAVLTMTDRALADDPAAPPLGSQADDPPEPSAAPAPPLAPPPSEPPPEEPYFYKGYEYGSQAVFNPLTVFLNRGFDVLQVRSANRNVFTQLYADNAANLVRNLADPFSNIEAAGGWGKLAREELLPLSFTPKGARWLPNYGLHLVGGGMTYRALREWFKAHDVPVPAAFSIGVVFAAAFLNETLENKGVVGPNTDALTDLYLFDGLGILLFSFDAVNRFFSRTVHLMDWSLQPTLSVTGATLHNQGNYFALKAPLPFQDRVELFGYIGFSSLIGLSLKLPQGYAVSAAGGSKVTTFEQGSTRAVANVVNFRPTGAVFLDRNNSLLASVQVADVPDYFLHANVYPNAFFHTTPGVGAWSVVAKDGRWMAGLSCTWTLGVGLSAGTLR